MDALVKRTKQEIERHAVQHYCGRKPHAVPGRPNQMPGRAQQADIPGELQQTPPIGTARQASDHFAIDAADRHRIDVHHLSRMRLLTQHRQKSMPVRRQPLEVLSANQSDCPMGSSRLGQR
jgi:hypothetical protein